MSQHDRVDRAGIEGKRVGIVAFMRAAALEQPAFDQQPAIPTSTRKQDPVTSRVAPTNWMCIVFLRLTLACALWLGGDESGGHRGHP
jgi:hypothetical protein